VKVDIYEQSSLLPPLDGGNFFHSRELMELCEQTPRQRPYMAVASDDDGRPVAHLLAIVRSRRSWMPPYLYGHVRIYGDNGCRADHFGMLVEALTDRLEHHSFYMEVSHLSAKMYGYRELKAVGFFPVRWMSIHNSLHSRTPEERISQRQLRRIEAAHRRGAETKEVETDDEYRAFSQLLRHSGWLKPHRYLPPDDFFKGLAAKGHCRLLITTFRQKVIGCAVVAYSRGDAYLWYSAARRKSFAPLHPNAVTLWAAIKHSHAHGLAHIRFMDVGLPFRKNAYRDFIMQFGGKEVSTYRWFRFSYGWLNRLASWLWRE